MADAPAPVPAEAALGRHEGQRVCPPWPGVHRTSWPHRAPCAPDRPWRGRPWPALPAMTLALHRVCGEAAAGLSGAPRCGSRLKRHLSRQYAERSTERMGRHLNADKLDRRCNPHSYSSWFGPPADEVFSSKQHGYGLGMGSRDDHSDRRPALAKVC